MAILCSTEIVLDKDVDASYTIYCGSDYESKVNYVVSHSLGNRGSKM